MSQSFIKKPDNGPHSALTGLGVLASERKAAAPQSRGPLTKDEVDTLVYQCRQAGDDSTYALVKAIEAAHGIGVAPNREGEQFIKLLDSALHHAKAAHAVRDRIDRENTKPIYDEAERARKAVIEYVLGTDGVTASDGGLWQVSYNGGESWVDWPRKPDPNRDAGLAMAKVRHLAGVTLPDGANMADPKIKNEHLIRGVLAGGVLQFKAGGQWIDCGGDADGWMSIIVAGGGCDPHTHRIKPGSVPHGVSGMEVQQIVECVFCKRQMIDGSQCTKPTIAAVCDMRTAGVKEGGDAPAA